METTMNLGGRTYEILTFLHKSKGEISVGGNVMVSRAKEMNANLGQEDCEYLLANQNDIPPALRGEVIFVFPSYRDHKHVAGVFWCIDRWIKFWFSDSPSVLWDDFSRLLRRRN